MYRIRRLLLALDSLNLVRAVPKKAISQDSQDWGRLRRVMNPSMKTWSLDFSQAASYSLRHPTSNDLNSLQLMTVRLGDHQLIAASRKLLTTSKSFAFKRVAQPQKELMKPRAHLKTQKSLLVLLTTKNDKMTRKSSHNSNNKHPSNKEYSLLHKTIKNKRSRLLEMLQLAVMRKKMKTLLLGISNKITWAIV